jgi:hypothetical protein
MTSDRLDIYERILERHKSRARVGAISYAPNKLDATRDLRDCQEHSLIFLYRLLFILYAEDRGLLPYRVNQTYTNNRSLARHRDDVAARLDHVERGLRATDYSRSATNLWEDLQDHFDLIDRGHGRYRIKDSKAAPAVADRAKQAA